MRGAVSLAAALAIPNVTDAGTAFPDRDLILFLAFTSMASAPIPPSTSAAWSASSTARWRGGSVASRSPRSTSQRGNRRRSRSAGRELPNGSSHVHVTRSGRRLIEADVTGVPVTQLTKLVIAPAAHGASVRERTSMTATGGDLEEGTVSGTVSSGGMAAAFDGSGWHGPSTGSLPAGTTTTTPR